jgi:hypothetical protein
MELRRRIEITLSLNPALYDLYRIDPPRLLRGECRTIARQAYASHSLRANDDPERIVEAEELALIWVPSMGAQCGLSTADMILLRAGADPLLTGLLIHHERGHCWLKRLKYRGYTEADAWVLTAELVLYRRERIVPAVPAWFLPIAGHALAA